VTRTARKNDFILYSCGTLKVSMKRKMTEKGILARVIEMAASKTLLKRLVNIYPERRLAMANTELPCTRPARKDAMANSGI